MLSDPRQLTALAEVLRLGSFEQAAADLGITQSAVSQRIRALEEQIGTPLIRRGSPCTATPAGARLARHAEDISLLEANLSRDLSLDHPSQAARLRVAVNADSLATWFVAAMAAVPDVLFELVIDDQNYSADWLKRGEVNAAVTATGEAVSGCDRVTLGALRYVATASPKFVARWFPDGVTANALAAAPCLAFNAKDALQRTWIEAQTGQRLSPPTHYLPSTHAFIDAARAGLGWGMNPEPLVRGPLRNQRLLALGATPALDIALDWQVSRIVAPALRPVTEAVRAAAKNGLVVS